MFRKQQSRIYYTSATLSLAKIIYLTPESFHNDSSASSRFDTPSPHFLNISRMVIQTRKTQNVPAMW